MNLLNAIFSFAFMGTIFNLENGMYSNKGDNEMLTFSILNMQNGYNNNLGQVNKNNYNNYVNVIDGSIIATNDDGEGFGYVYYLGLLRIYDKYRHNNSDYILFSLDLTIQLTPGCAASQSESVEFMDKYYNKKIDNAVSITSGSVFYNNYGLADYWPASESSLNLPNIVVTENHTSTLTVGVSYDVSNDQSVTIGYDAFGAKASRAVNLGIDGSYTYAYSVTEQYTRTNPTVTFGRNATNVGFHHIFDNFSYNEKTESFIYTCGGLFDCKVSNSGTYGGKININTSHVLGYKNWINIEKEETVNYSTSVEFFFWNN